MDLPMSTLSAPRRRLSMASFAPRRRPSDPVRRSPIAVLTSWVVVLNHRERECGEEEVGLTGVERGRGYTSDVASSTMLLTTNQINNGAD
jgi:hypothetical protein